MNYARMASEVLEGSLELGDDHFAYRWSILGPTALSYYFFGINDFGSAIPALVITFLTLLMVYGATKHLSVTTTIVAQALYVLTAWSLFFSDKLMPDIFTAFACMGAFLIIFKLKQGIIKSPLIASLLFSVFILYGLLAKASIVMLVPVMAVLMVLDLRKGQNRSFWTMACAILLVATICYLYLLYSITGEPMSRVNAIDASNFHEMSSFEDRPFLDLIKRLTVGLPLKFSEEVFGVSMFLSASLLLSLKRPLKLSIEKVASFFPVVLLLSFLAANFMTTSSAAYVPMLGECRHFLFLVPIAAIVAAPVICGFFLHTTNKREVLLVAVGAAVLSFFTGNSISIYTHLSILIIVAVRCFLPSNAKHILKLTFLLAFISVLFVKPIDDFIIGMHSNYEAQKLLIANHLLGADEHTVVISNTVQKNFAEYYQGFQGEGKPRWITYKEEPGYAFQSNDEIYVLNNSSTQALSALSYFDGPLYARRIPDGVEPIHVEKGLVLYRVMNRGELILEESIMFQSNDFEQPNSYWSDYSESVSNEYSFSGIASNVIPAHGFSASYNLPFSELIALGANFTHLVCSINIRAEDVDEIELVMIAEEAGENILWSSSKGDGFEPLQDNWWRAVKHQEYTLDKLSEAVLRVYVWNRGGDRVFVDDFEIEVFQY
jgi:hypothetical protein